MAEDVSDTPDEISSLEAAQAKYCFFDPSARLGPQLLRLSNGYCHTQKPNIHGM